MTLLVKRMDFLFLAGHPCLDFLNTNPNVKGKPVELLQSFDDFARWLTQAGSRDGRIAADAVMRWKESDEGPQIVERARAFRETLRTMLEAVAHGESCSTVGPAAINHVLAENDGSLRLERHGNGFRTRFAARAQQPIALLGGIAESAARLLCDGKLRLVRLCANPECNLFFYDATRNHRRQWCAMGTCGNLMKVRAFRRRHKKTA